MTWQAELPGAMLHAAPPGVAMRTRVAGMAMSRAVTPQPIAQSSAVPRPMVSPKAAPPTTTSPMTVPSTPAWTR
ncbi:hypothetical protein ACWD26_26320 [Streptomyces sp. NPDC002787]